MRISQKNDRERASGAAFFETSSTRLAASQGKEGRGSDVRLAVFASPVGDRSVRFRLQSEARDAMALAKKLPDYCSWKLFLDVAQCVAVGGVEGLPALTWISNMGLVTICPGQLLKLCWQVGCRLLSLLPCGSEPCAAAGRALFMVRLGSIGLRSDRRRSQMDCQGLRLANFER